MINISFSMEGGNFLYSNPIFATLGLDQHFTNCKVLYILYPRKSVKSKQNTSITL